MVRINTYKILLAVAVLLLFASCKRVVVKVDRIPSNTPRGQSIYITGNFNNWDPGELRYRMDLNPDSSYTIKLPPGLGTIEYKFTRGDWTSVEKDICGYELSDRSITIGEEDTVVNSIESWNDRDPVNCPRLTLVVPELPKDTPDSAKISIAGTFNSWNPDQGSVMQTGKNGQHYITIQKPANVSEIEFKVTRGSMATSESDQYGNPLPNRKLVFGKQDTVKLNVEGWIDKNESGPNKIALIIRKLPSNTLSSDDIFFVSSMNNWLPGDRNYQFQKNKKGLYEIDLPRKKQTVEYKITHGDWWQEEVDRFGYDIPNRSIDLDKQDTVYIDVQNWKDRSQSPDHDVTLTLTKIPSNTPVNDKIYIAGNFNNWNPGKRKDQLQKNASGYWSISIPRETGDLDFKFTRGSWNSLEVDKYGSGIPNRHYLYNDIDTLYLEVANWSDLPRFDARQVTIVLNSIPATTPAGQNIFIVGTFNNWDPGDRKYIMSTLKNGKNYITLKKSGDQIEYKITRGDWNTAEVDKNGNEIANRTLAYGFADTVYINIAKWRDQGGKY